MKNQFIVRKRYSEAASTNDIGRLQKTPGQITSVRKAQWGQGMTEYIIIVALIAVAAIGVISAFGGVVQHQFAGMAQALSGNAATNVAQATASAATASGAAGDKTLSTYAQ